MSQSFIQPFYGIEPKTLRNSFEKHSQPIIHPSNITPDDRIVKIWTARNKPKSSHPFWNCITQMDATTVLSCYGNTVYTSSFDDASRHASCHIEGSILVDIERHHENTKFVLVRSSAGQISIVRIGENSSGPTLHVVDSVDADPMAQMCLDGQSSFYCIGDSQLLSVYDLSQPKVPIFNLKRESPGPVSFASSSQPHIIYQGCRTYLGIVDMRESSEVARIVPNPAQITLTSYSTLLKYSCLAVNPVRETEVVAFTQQHHAVQVFDPRFVRSPVFEWSLPGREYRTEDRLPPPPVRHVEYSQDGSNILINRPMRFSSYVVSLDPPHSASPFIEIPTCTDYDAQIEVINKRRISAMEAKYPPARSQQSSREFNAMKFLYPKVMESWIEFSLGACFGRNCGEIFSISSRGQIYRLSSESSSSPHAKFQPSHIPISVGVARIEPIKSQTVPLSQVQSTLTRLDRKFRPAARYPRAILEVSNRDKFFLFSICRIIPNLPTCQHHRGAEKSTPGSYVWNLCVNACGFRRPSQPPVDPIGTVYVTTVRQMQFAYNEMYGAHLHAKTIVEFFDYFFNQTKFAQNKVNPNLEFQWYPGSPDSVPDRNPILFDSLDCPAIIAIVKVSAFGVSLQSADGKKSVAPTIQEPTQTRASSSSSSSDEDDDDDLFSQKRPRIDVPSVVQKKSQLVVTDLTPLAGDVLKNRYITMEIVNDLRSKWTSRNYEFKRKPKPRKKENGPVVASAGADELAVNEEVGHENDDGDRTEEETVCADTPSDTQLETPPETPTEIPPIPPLARLSELLRGGSLKPR